MVFRIRAPIMILLTLIVIVYISGTGAASSVKVVDASSGMYHTIVLMSDGTVYTWGDSKSHAAWGILGTGENFTDGSISQVKNLSWIVAVDTQFLTSLAIDQYGNVWAWGENANGNCGDGTNVIRFVPVKVKNLSNISHVSAGSGHCVAVDKDGNVWAWGRNKYGELGIGYTGEAVYGPVRVPIDDVKAVYGGNGFTIALKNDGTVWAWGSNEMGQTGNMSGDTVLTPVMVSGLSNITKIDIALYHTLALKEDGTVWGWGNGFEGNIGDVPGYDGEVAVFMPIQIQGLNNIVDISTSPHHSMALDETGMVYVWGCNEDGQFGNTNAISEIRTSPGQVQGMGTVSKISAGFGHCIAIEEDGTVWGWGRNDEGQIGKKYGMKVLSPTIILNANEEVDGSSLNNNVGMKSANLGLNISNMVMIAGVAGLIIIILCIIYYIKIMKK